LISVLVVDVISLAMMASFPRHLFAFALILNILILLHPCVLCAKENENIIILGGQGGMGGLPLILTGGGGSRFGKKGGHIIIMGGGLGNQPFFGYPFAFPGM